jgi:hypothetical protein
VLLSKESLFFVFFFFIKVGSFQYPLLCFRQLIFPPQKIRMNYLIQCAKHKCASCFVQKTHFAWMVCGIFFSQIIVVILRVCSNLIVLQNPLFVTSSEFETFFIFYSEIKAKKSFSLLVLTTRQNCKQTTMHGLSSIWTTIRTKLHNTWLLPYESYISEVISTLLQTHKYRIPQCIPSP